jgi:hypothetical protein
LNGATEKIAGEVADLERPIYRRSVSCFAYREIFHDPFELRVHGVKALECLREHFLITQVLFGPAFEALINPEAFDSTEFVSLQVCIVNEFGESKQSSVALAKPTR